MANGNKIILTINNVSQSFGKQTVLHDINLQVIQGQFVGIVGPSGCGKTTLFNTILGTCPPKRGYVETNGIRVTGPNRNVGVVYQRYGLYRFLTAEENVAFGLKLDKSQWWQRMFMPWWWWPLRREHMKAARALLEKVKLGHAMHLYPRKLSGGMQQRVAICQSLIMRPYILLLDEPFGALDEATRESLQKMLLHLYRENLEAKKRGEDPPWTVLFITHELNEAFYVSDRIVGLSRNWHEASTSKKGVELGSTKVWDKCSPVYEPDAPKNFDLFYAAKQELKEAVLSESASPVERNQHVSFWDDLALGVGTGVAMTRSIE